MRQRVGKVVVVEVNLDGLVLHRDHPEHVVPVNVRVVVVNLLSEVGRSNRTGVQVKSNKGERAFMQAAVRTDEFALTEPHVGLGRQSINPLLSTSARRNPHALSGNDRGSGRSFVPR